MKITAVVLLSVVSCIAAYDFEDQVYNQLLSEQLLAVNPRLRRAASTNDCNHEAIQNYHRSDRAISQECYKELNVQQVNPAQMTEQQKNDFKCVVECIGKKKGYLDANGKLLNSKLLEEIKGKLGAVDWLAPKLVALYEDCSKEAENKQKEANQCNDIGLTIGHCIWSKSQSLCHAN